MSNTEPRDLTPVQMFWSGDKPSKDFSPRVQKVERKEVTDEGPTAAELAEIELAEKALVPVPKDSSAQESVPSKESTEQAASETPVPQPVVPPMPTQVKSQEDADSESGKDSDSSEDEPQTPNPPAPSPVPSTPASLPPTSPGKNTPPVVAKPPIGD